MHLPQDQFRGYSTVESIERTSELSNPIVNIILPLFGIMLAGFLAGHTGALNKSSGEILGRFVYVVSLPALVFIKLSNVSVEEFFNWSFLGALGGGMLATFCIGLLVARFVFHNTLTAQALHGLSAMYSSTAYIGLPLILLLFGDDGLVPALIGSVITGVLFLPIGIAVAEFDQEISQRKEGRKTIIAPLLNVLLSPVLVATVAGLTASALGLLIPSPVTTFCELLGDAFIPCSLFSAGFFIAGCSIKGATGEIGWLVFAKLLLHPMLSWWLAYHVFELERMLAAIVVLQAALPSGVPVFVLAQQYNTFAARSSAVIVVSTALSVFTLSGLLILLLP